MRLLRIVTFFLLQKTKKSLSLHKFASTSKNPLYICQEKYRIMVNRINSLKEFYPYYLKEHQHPTSRLLHFIGTGLVILILFSALVSNQYLYLILIPFIGYGFAWVGHFFFEKNKPATFKYPLYSLASDFILFFDILKGKEKIKAKKL